MSANIRSGRYWWLAGLVLLCGYGAYKTYDGVIRGGTLTRGTGAMGRLSDLAIAGDRIREIGSEDGFVTYPPLATYVRDQKLMSMEEAIRKLTALPSQVIHLPNRGTLKTGNFADVLVVDLKNMDGRATLEQPSQYAAGMRYALVNGVPVVRERKYTVAPPGHSLRGSGLKKC